MKVQFTLKLSLPRGRLLSCGPAAPAPEAGASSLVPEHLLLTNATCGRRDPAPLPWASLQLPLFDQVSIVPRRSGQCDWAAGEGMAGMLDVDMHFMGTLVAIDAVSCQCPTPSQVTVLGTAHCL